MLIDRTHRTWFFISAAVLAVATASYVVYALRATNGPTGGTVMGLIYGIIGTLLMIFAGLLAGRRTVPHWSLGSAQFWLRGHLWLGGLSVPFILFHSGFGWGGLLENVLWITFGLVIASGVYGLVLQQILPRILMVRVPLETFRQQIPFLCGRTRFLADRLIAVQCGKLNIDGDAMLPLIGRLVEFGKTAGRGEKDDWIKLVDEPLRPLFGSLARHAKQERWIRMESDFPKLLGDVYEVLNADATGDSAPRKPAAPAPARRDPAPESRPAPAPPASETPGATSAALGKPLSKLEQARAAARGGKAQSQRDDRAGEAEGATPKPLSKLEQARAAARKGGTPPGGPERPQQPASKLEQARAAARSAAASKGASVGAEASSPGATAASVAAATGQAGTPDSPRPMSKLEQARAAAKKSRESKESGGPSARPPEEPAPAGAAAEGGAGDSEAAAAADDPATGLKTIQFSPIDPDQLSSEFGVPVEPVGASAGNGQRSEAAVGGSGGAPPVDVERDIQAIERLLVERYRYAEDSASRIAGRVRPFLHEAPAAAPVQPALVSQGIGIPCPQCGKVMQLPDRSLLGRRARCFSCSHKFVLKESDASNAPPTATAQAPPGADRPAMAGSRTGPRETPPPAPAAEASSTPPEQPARAPSKLEQARAQAAAKRGSASPKAAAPAQAAGKPMSKLEQARAAGAAGSGKAKPAPPTSKLEQARAAAAKGKPAGGPAPDDNASEEKPAKPLSKVEQMRAAAAARKGEAGGSGASKPMPSVARASSAAKKPPAGKGASPVGKKPEGVRKKVAGSAPPPRAGELKEFYLRDVRPWLDARTRRTDRMADPIQAARLFAHMRAELPAELHPTLADLEASADERRQFAFQKRIHRWLHGWLLLHIPLSIALFVLMIAHIVMALRVVPFSF